MPKVKIIKEEKSYGVGYPGWNRTIKIELIGAWELAYASWPNVHGPSFSFFRSIEAAKEAYDALPEGEADLDDVVPYLVGHYLIDLAKAGFRTPAILEGIESYLAELQPDYAASVRRRLGLHPAH